MRVYQITVDGRIIFVRADSAETALRIARNTVGSNAQLANDGNPVTEGVAREAAGAQFIRQDGTSQFARGVTISNDRDRGNFFNSSFRFPVSDPEPVPEAAAPITSGAVDAGALQQGQDLFPFGSFLEAAGARGFDPEGQFGTTVRRQFDPLRAASRLAGVVQGLPSEEDTSFQQFFGENIGRGGQIASQTLQNLFAGNLAPTGLAQGRAQQFLNPDVLTEQGRGDVNTLRQLARSAGAEQFSPFVARNLLPGRGRVTRELEALQARGGFGAQGNQTFQEFLTGQFGLRF